MIANIMYSSAPGETKRLIDADIRRYSFGKEPKGKLLGLDNILLSGEKSFRSVFYYRFRNRKLICGICRIFLPDIKEIELYANISEDVYLSSSYMIVGPQKTGKNLSIGAGVIVSKSNGGCPIIGDNVVIGANSTVIGNITIGDNVIIKAGSVVTRDIPSNTVYGGNPAKFICENTKGQEMQ